MPFLFITEKIYISGIHLYELISDGTQKIILQKYTFFSVCHILSEVTMPHLISRCRKLAGRTIMVVIVAIRLGPFQ